MRTIFLAHAAADHEFASRLAEFLESGCDLTCYLDEGRLAPGEDLLTKAADGLSADVLALLLSGASLPVRWARDRWEPLLMAETRRMQVELFSILLGDCPFPPLLRRRNFFDASVNSVTAMRLLKRSIRRTEQDPGPPCLEVSSDLEELYAVLADRAGTLETSGAAAARFAREAAGDFDAVLWVPCSGRSLAQAAGELGAQLGLRLEGTVQENCQRIREFLPARRGLLVLDAPAAPIVAGLASRGRTSTLVTAEPVQVVETPFTVAYGRTLVSSGRYAEAYELFYALIDRWVDTETCARELSWICEHWDRAAEANALRFQYGSGPAEQLALF